MRPAASRIFWTAGNSRPINTARIAMTTSSSMRVKALLKGPRPPTRTAGMVKTSNQAHEKRRLKGTSARAGSFGHFQIVGPGRGLVDYFNGQVRGLLAG